jgi:hypothetical protein
MSECALDTYRRFDAATQEWVYDVVCYIHDDGNCEGEHEMLRVPQIKERTK